MDRVARTIEELHDATALWEATIPVHRAPDERAVCEGKVEIFQLVGHPRAQRCFAWEGENGSGERTVHVVLRLPPIDSAEDAVRSVISQNHNGVRRPDRRLVMSKTQTDRIEKKALIQAPVSRVWRALTKAGEFGAWFRVKLEGEFAVGKRITGHMTYPGYEHVKFEATVERMDAEKLFSFRWHPYAVDPKVDYSKEPTTLVEFRLEEQKGGMLLTVVESGFDRLPAGRRDEAFRMNDQGWAIQLENVEHHVAK
jgi:uncharacterized protein YndB with AHSA1/START domain